VVLQYSGTQMMSPPRDLTLRKLLFESQKIAKNLTLFFKLQKNSVFYKKNCQWQFFGKKKTILGNCFEKMSFWQFFDIQMANFWRVSSDQLK